MNKRRFVVMAKPVGSRCSMRCRYCYYLDKDKYSSSEKQSRMSFGVLERIIKQTMEASEGPAVSFVWHGGEPTLAGIDFYEKALELERKYLPKGFEVWNNIQTNGLALNDRWCEFLKRGGFDVGVSIDGPPSVHDKNRTDLGGRGTFERASEAVKRLKAHGIEPDILCTVNADSAGSPVEVYRALRALGTGWVQFIPVVVPSQDGILPISVTPDAYGRFLIEVFDEWCENDLGKTDVQLFAETARIVAGGSPSLCWMCEECGSAIVCEEDGSVYSCDHFVDDEHRLGNVMGGSILSMLCGQEQIDFGKSKKLALSAECASCEYLRFCGGGCLKDRFGPGGKYWLCRGLKCFFAHAVPILERIVKMSSSGMSPDEIMQTIRTKEET